MVNALRTTGRRAAAERFEDAFRALCENCIAEYAAGTPEETPEYLYLNNLVTETERGIRWWRRELIAHRILRELGYFSRTGGTG